MSYFVHVITTEKNRDKLFHRTAWNRSAARRRWGWRCLQVTSMVLFSLTFLWNRGLVQCDCQCYTESDGCNQNSNADKSWRRSECILYCTIRKIGASHLCRCWCCRPLDSRCAPIVTFSSCSQPLDVGLSASMLREFVYCGPRVGLYPTVRDFLKQAGGLEDDAGVLFKVSIQESP